MKKSVVFSIALCVIMGLFSGCGGNVGDDGVLNIVCTTFPIYDWTCNIVGEDNRNIEVTLLLDNGVDMHSFQPGAKDIALVSSCDMLIYVGGESDVWLEDALKESANKSQRAISLIELLGDKAKEEDEIEIPSGEENDTEVKDEAFSGHFHGDRDSSGEEIEYDEHIWLSLTNAMLCVDGIAEKICELDSDNKEAYLANAEKYISRLQALDTSVRERMKAAQNNTIIVADRFPFRYMVDDYNVGYYAAFPGCSTETEASFEVVVYLAGKLDSTGAKYVVVTETSDNKIAETVISNTREKNQEIIILDSMQSKTLEDYKNGRTYYSIMDENLNNLLKVSE